MNLLRAASAIGGWTMLSRLLGFARDFVLARVFGAGMATDAFFVAFKLPNLLRRLFAEGAFSQAFVPLLAATRNQEGDEATRQLVDEVSLVLVYALVIVVIVGIVGAPLLVWLSAPGFCRDPGGEWSFWQCGSSPTFQLTVLLTRFTFPYILFMSLVAMAGGILNTWSRFSIPAFTPVLLNLAMIAAALWLSPWVEPPVLALALGVVVGGFLQLALQWPALRAIKMTPRWRWDPRPAWRSPKVRRILQLMAPAVVGVSVAQISLLINTLLASLLTSGSVSWLYYADRLMELPTALLGVALGTVLLPSLSKHHAAGATAEYSRLLDWGLKLTCLLSLPASLGLALLAKPLIATLFLHGAFTVRDAEATAIALQAYCVGMSGLIFVKILAPGFYARQDVRTPVKIALISLAVTQLLNIAFIGWLQHAGLALSTGLASCINAGLLYIGLRKKGVYRPQPGWWLFIVKIALALVVMGFALALLLGDANAWWRYNGVERVWRLSVLIVAGLTSYFACLALLGFRWRDFKINSAS